MAGKTRQSTLESRAQAVLAELRKGPAAVDDLIAAVTPKLQSATYARSIIHELRSEGYVIERVTVYKLISEPDDD